MITALRIQNLAIVESLEVLFGEGFNVITGETGAGKSLLVDALHLVLGGRASLDLVRTGSDEASVEALFEGLGIDTVLDAQGLPTDGGNLLIRRTLSCSGRGRVWINGALSTVGQLEKLAHGLIDISGQHEHVSLLDPGLHLDLLDAFAGNGELLKRYRAAHASLLDCLKQRDALLLDDVERARRLDYLRFQIDEIELVAPEPGELEALDQERQMLASVERQRRSLNEAETLLYSGEASVLDQMAFALNALNDLVTLVPKAAGWTSALESTRIEIDELVRELGRHARDLRESPERLEEVADRIEAIRRLCRKHGGTPESVLERRDAMRAELDGFERQEERLQELDTTRAHLGQEALTLARQLSATRQRAASDFAHAVQAELKKLAMDKTSFEVALMPHASTPGMTQIEGSRLDGRGLETGEFLLSPNRGESIKPLARIASGGELSRLMLAIKRVLAKLDPVFTYVFDEVDTGMSGSAADAVGRLLEEVSRERQVIVVTHLPQIAVFGHRHFIVEKQPSGDRVRAEITLLSEEARTREIARMLAGSEVLPAALENARAMIEASRAVHTEALDSSKDGDTKGLERHSSKAGTANTRTHSRK